MTGETFEGTRILRAYSELSPEEVKVIAAESHSMKNTEVAKLHNLKWPATVSYCAKKHPRAHANSYPHARLPGVSGMFANHHRHYLEDLLVRIRRLHCTVEDLVAISQKPINRQVAEFLVGAVDVRL